jgi:polysaccharide export outer membrane protein
MVYLSNGNFETEISQARYSELHIQEGDVLEITISALDELAVKPFNKITMSQTANNSGNSNVNNRMGDNEYIVNAEGFINFPVIGDIFCKGFTKQQLRTDLENKLKRYLTDPMVSIKLNNFSINILGDVKNPGQKTSATEKINIFQALALAGDMNDSGNRTNVKLVRYSEETKKDEIVSLDLSDASIVNSPYYYLQQNDILYVEPDKNRQIAANATNPNRGLLLQIGAALLGLGTFILAVSK